MSVYDKLDSGYYKNTKLYPSQKIRKEESGLYKFMIDDYRSEDKRIRDEFRKDIENEYGTDTLPEEVRNAIYSFAYEKGHAYGYSEIANEYSDLMDVVYLLMKYIKE